MASIRERTLNSGKTSYSVLYRHGHRQASKTFLDAKSAKNFKSLVDLLGADKALRYAQEEQRDDRLTVSDLLDRYLDWKATRVTPRTIQDYSRDIEKWIKPALGHLAADLLDETDVQKWVDSMTGKLAAKTIGDKHMILHSAYAFGCAKSRGLVTHNPCRETDLPEPGKKKPPKGTTTPEFRAIRAAAASYPDADDLILFLGETGWRFSEAIALTVRDVEDDGTNVWATVTQVFRVDGQGRQYLAAGEAKSQAGFRRIRMFPATRDMLRQRVISKAPEDLVFTNGRGSHWNQNTFLRETWPSIIKRAGLGDRRPTPHWLRHMHVAVCAAAGVPMHEIQRRIGHEHYSTTVDVYGGMIGDMDEAAMAKAAALMSGESTAPRIAPAEVVLGQVIEQQGPPQLT